VNITIHAFAYTEEEDLDQVMPRLQQSQLRYFLGAITPSSWKDVLRKAYDFQLIGNDVHHWLFGGMTAVVTEGFTLDAETEGDLALALHGVGVVAQKLIPHDAFDRALADIADDVRLQQEFISVHNEPDLLENFTFSSELGQSKTQYMTYDAVIALGITACQTAGNFTGREFYDNLVKANFTGVSGRVNFHPLTGTRLDDAFEFEIINLRISPQKSSPAELAFDANASVLVDFPISGGPGRVTSLDNPFLYYGNTTIPPLVLPPITQDLNLIPTAILILGYVLMAIVMLLSLGCALWVHRRSDSYVVRAAQPYFLFQLCLGTFIMACTIIPLSFQEDLPGLDHACQAIPWCACIGFCTAMSALFSKSHRINQLMNSGTTFRRVRLDPQDVMRPFYIMLLINLILLTIWSGSPYHFTWHREPVHNYDEFGRSVESIGYCYPGGGNGMYLIFLVPLVLVNVLVLVLATFQTYKAKDLPTEFSETRYLALSMLSMSETFILGATTIVAVMDNPTGLFLVVSILISIVCLSILLPMFVPKYHQRNKSEREMRESIQSFNARRSALASATDRASLIASMPVRGSTNVRGSTTLRGSTSGVDKAPLSNDSTPDFFESFADEGKGTDTF